MDTARLPLQLGVAEVVGLHVGDESAAGLKPHGVGEGAEQRAGILGADLSPLLAAAHVAFAHDALGDLKDRVRTRLGRIAVPVRGRVLDQQRARGQAHRGVGPLGGAALLAARIGAALADVSQKLFRRGRGGRLGERPPDVHAGVIVRAAGAGTTVRLDVDRGRHVELARAGAVAGLPDREKLRELAPVRRREGRLNRVEGMCEGAGDLVGVQVLRAGLDVAIVLLQPGVIVGADPEAEQMDGLRLAAEPDGELLGDEDVITIGDLEASVDRVVIGDRHEVHAPPLGELVDLLRRRRALRKAEAPLDPQLRDLGRGRVTVQVHPAGGNRAHLTPAFIGSLVIRRVAVCRENPVTRWCPPRKEVVNGTVATLRASGRHIREGSARRGAVERRRGGREAARWAAPVGLPRRRPRPADHPDRGGARPRGARGPRDAPRRSVRGLDPQRRSPADQHRSRGGRLAAARRQLAPAGRRAGDGTRRAPRP